MSLSHKTRRGIQIQIIEAVRSLIKGIVGDVFCLNTVAARLAEMLLSETFRLLVILVKLRRISLAILVLHLHGKFVLEVFDLKLQRLLVFGKI